MKVRELTTLLSNFPPNTEVSIPFFLYKMGEADQYFVKFCSIKTNGEDVYKTQDSVMWYRPIE